MKESLQSAFRGMSPDVLAGAAVLLGEWGRHLSAFTKAKEMAAALLDDNFMETLLPVSFVYRMEPLDRQGIVVSGDVVVRSTWNTAHDGSIDVQTACYLSHVLERNLLCVPCKDPLVDNPASLFSYINSTFWRNSMRFEKRGARSKRLGNQKIMDEIHDFHNAAVQKTSEAILASLALAKDSIVSIRE